MFASDISTHVEKKVIAKAIEVPVTPTSPEKSFEDMPILCPVDDVELQNAIWNITPDLNLENPTVPSDQMSFDDFLMDHAGDDNTGVLFDLS